jgi:Fe-S-cluster-containing dehydrogenase component
MSKQCIPNTIRDPSPCLGCSEKFTACSDRCPKSARGEYGYQEWMAEIKRVKRKKKEYDNRANVRKKNYDGGYYGEP